VLGLMVVSKWTVRQGLSGVSSFLIVLAYITCIGIAKSGDVYTGGLSMPYFSDIGRDKPGYFVFAGLITTASVLMMAFMPLQYMYNKEWLATGKGKCRNASALVVGFLAPVGSILLSCFDTSSYPSLHNYSAYAFFVLIIVWAVLTLLIFRTLAVQEEEHRKLLFPRYVVMTVLAVAFILYIPVGLAIVEWDNLTIDRCELLGLEGEGHGSEPPTCKGVLDNDTCAKYGYDDCQSALFGTSLQIICPILCGTCDSDDLRQQNSYCEAHRLVGTNHTDLFDYTKTEGVNLMRTSSQFLCVVSIMCFLFINVFDPHPTSTVAVNIGDFNAATQKWDQKYNRDSARIASPTAEPTEQLARNSITHI
jgi:hypothetical protein